MLSESSQVRIILNGDDFGFSKGINKGILDSINRGILTSTSVMVHRPFAYEAKKLIKYKNISVGLHLDLTEENPLQRWSKFLYILTWPKTRLKYEFEKQINKFVEITGKHPDHIDSHHNIHLLTGFKSIILDFSIKNKIPVRCANATFEMGFYGRSFFKWNDSGKVTPERLISVIKKLKPGVHEIMCHPGYLDGDLSQTGTKYLSQRENEVSALTNPKVKNFINGQKNIELISWKGVRSSEKGN